MFGNNKDRSKWNIRQRIIVFGLVAATTIPAAILYLSSRSWKLPNIDLNKLVDLKNNYVYESSDSVEKDLQEKFRAHTNLLTGIYGFYYYEFDSGAESSIYAQRQFEAASLMKLPVMAAFWAEVEKGNLNPDQAYVLKNDDKVGGSGVLQNKQPGYETTYTQMLTLMGKQSDNIAYRIIRREVGDEAVNKILLKAGMYNTDLIQNKTTPADIGSFYKSLLQGVLVNSEHKDQILDSLTGTIYEDYLPAGLPEDVEVAHKYGRETHVLHDAGIVWTSHPYILVLMSEGVIDSEAETVFPDLSRLFYDHQGNLAD